MAEQPRGGDRKCGQPAEGDQQRPGFVEAGGQGAVDEQAGAAVAGPAIQPVLNGPQSVREDAAARSPESPVAGS